VLVAFVALRSKDFRRVVADEHREAAGLTPTIYVSEASDGASEVH
jgi:galactokinase